MKQIQKYGNYSVIMYDENFVTIDFTDENVEFTIQTFDNLEKALTVFNNTVKALPVHKAKYHNTNIIKRIVESK